MSSSSFPPQSRMRTEKETEVFRYWLEETGVLESFTKAIAKINCMKKSDRPKDPIKYISECMIKSEQHNLVSEVSWREVEYCEKRIQELSLRVKMLLQVQQHRLAETLHAHNHSQMKELQIDIEQMMLPKKLE